MVVFGMPRRAGLPPPCRRPSALVRFFASSHTLQQLAPRTLLLCALMLIGILGQAVTGILMHHRGPGWTPESVVAHYRGRTVDHAALSDAELQRALVGDPAFTDTPPKTWEALLDVAHMHLAWMPLLVFLVAHLFAMSPWGRGRLGGILGYGTLAAALLDILAPFLVRYGAPGWAWLKLSAFVALEVGFLLMILLTLLGGIQALRRPDQASRPR